MRSTGKTLEPIACRFLLDLLFGPTRNSATRRGTPRRRLGDPGCGGRPLALLLLFWGVNIAAAAEPASSARACRGEGLPALPTSPVSLAVSADRSRLWIACATEPQVAEFDLRQRRVIRQIPLPAPPTAVVLDRNGDRVFVTCAAVRSLVCVIEPTTGQLLRQIPAGHTAGAPVLSLDEQVLYVCNRFDDDVSFLRLSDGVELCRVRVSREPIAAASTPDGRHLLVANHLPSGRANVDVVAASVSVIDTTSGQRVRDIPLPNGSGLLRGLCLSPDGRYACVAHVLARFHFLPRMIHLGWINQNAISLIDFDSWTHFATVPLDEAARGAANPWAVAWTPDGRFLGVAHAGTHELSVIDAPALLERLAALPDRVGPRLSPSEERFAHYVTPRYGPARSREEVPHDFAFLRGLRQRIPLGGQGARAIAVTAGMAYIANYFSDSLGVAPLNQAARQSPGPTTIPLSPATGPANQIRVGERLFNDATLCFHGWQSCASCHDADARTDALNWDLLNDGPHNPKNTRSLLFSPRTPPVMSLRVRDQAATAVRAGLHHILFSKASPETAAAIDAYLESLQPVPSPHLEAGRLSAAAERGRRIFHRADTGCASCHPPPLFTDLGGYDVGTAGDYDHAGDAFDTPTLVEVWRTAPYLHDGSAATLRDVLTRGNPNDQHGRTSQLDLQEIDDLVEYLLTR